LSQSGNNKLQQGKEIMARTRTPSVYELNYEEPPARGGAGGGQLYAVLEKLLADDTGQFAAVARCNSRSGANSILTSVKQGKRLLPAPVERFEFTTRTDGETNTSTLYAKTVPEGQAKPAPAKRRGRPPKNPQA
jgi:hypothetical protein